MIFTAGNILLIGSILLFVSIIVGKTGYRFGVPALLLFLVVGMLFGSDGLGLQFHNAKEAQFIGMVALSIILFSGGMDTKFTEIKPILTPGIVLSTAGVLLTALFTGLFIWWLSGMSWTNIHLPLITFNSSSPPEWEFPRYWALLPYSSLSVPQPVISSESWPSLC